MTDENKFDLTSNQRNPNVDSGNNAVDIMTINKYKFIEEAFYGTNGFYDNTYLTPHPREMFYDRRRQYSHYANYVNPIITAMYKAVFGEQIKRDYNNELFELFENDCTSTGVNLTDFVKLCVKYIRMHGMVLIIIDNKNLEGLELRQDLINNKKIPHCYIKKAYEINSDGCTFDEYGRLITVMYFDHHETDENGNTINFYRFWDSIETILYKQNKDCTSDEFHKKYETIEHSPNLLGKLPCQIIYEEPLDNPKKLFSEPLRYQLAKINHTIFDQDSEGRNVERNQGFGVLTMPVNAQGDQKDIVVGANNFLGYPHDSQHTPEMIGIDPNLILALESKRNSTMESLVAIAEQSGVQGINKSKDAKSGLAYAFEFFAYESTLKDSSRLAINIEMIILDFFNSWTNENIEYEPNYPINFKPNKVSEEQLNINESIELTGCPKPFHDDLWLEKYKLMFPANQEGLDKLKTWLEEQEEPELMKDIENEEENEEE